jgi:Ca2+-binding EF-hand superfamily protein
MMNARLANVVKTYEEEDKQKAEGKTPTIFYVYLDDPDKNGDNDDEDIMSYLNYRKLEEIKKDFNRSEADGLSLEQFLKVMLNHLGAEYTDKTKLVKELIELFRQIDVNNDGTLEWEEFTNHIIELGMVRKDRSFINAIKNYYASDLKDTEKHDTEIEHMYYIEKLKHLLVMERDSKRFKVYNAKTGRCI